MRNINYKKEVLTLEDTKSKRHKSAKRSRYKKRYPRRINFRFAIQIIICTIFLYYIAVASSEWTDFSQSASRVEVVEEVENISLQIPTEAVTEPVEEVVSVETTEPVTEVLAEPFEEVPQPLEIHQIAVGQANAYLIRYDNFTIFVDGGRTRSYPVVQKYLENFGVERVDMYIATHWHGDHVENMNRILKDYGHEQTIFLGTTPEITSKYDIPETPYNQMIHGTGFNIGDVVFLCVGPDEILHNGTENPDSINLLIQYDDFKFLMTADYIKDAAIETYGEFLRDVDVLQMPHHGLQPFRMSENAMLHCNPETMLVPVDNSYDSRHFLKTLDLETKVYDNKDGNIAIVSYGDDYEVYTNVNSPVDLV